MAQGSKDEFLPADFQAGESSGRSWSAGVVLERILIRKPTQTLPDSYMGPRESCTAGGRMV